MEQAIIICHHPENKLFLDNILKSLKKIEYPIIIVINDYKKMGLYEMGLYEISELNKKYKVILNRTDDFELGALRLVLEKTNYNEIFLMQDSCEIKSNKLFNLLFKKYKGKSVAVGYKFLHYLGKYRRDILEKMVLPDTFNKEASIFNESRFNNQYRDLDPDFITINPPLHTSEIFEEKCGRLNMKLENEYIIKWKGTWSISQLRSGNNRIVEIIVVTIGEDFEENCLKSIKENTNYPHALTEYRNNNEGLSVVWNKLIQKSKAEFICLLNSDTLVEKDWLRNMVKYIRTDIGIVAPVSNYAGDKQTQPKGDGIEEVDTLSGFCMLFPKKVWEEVGGFDEQFYFYFEDADFCKRVKQKGYKLLIIKEVFIEHLGQMASRKKVDFDWRKEYKKSEKLYKLKWQA